MWIVVHVRGSKDNKEKKDEEENIEKQKISTIKQWQNKRRI